MNEFIIHAQGVKHRYGHRWALCDVDLTLTQGKLLALAGANGSGKTTLLKSLSGLIKVTSGTIKVFGMDPFRNRVALMRQARFSFAPPPLYDSLTAYEHLKFLTAVGTDPQLRPTSRDMSRVLAMVGLADRVHDKTSVFSFGMRQRLALAISLLPLPQLLVMDEPTSGLDPLAILELRDILRRLRDSHGLTIVLTSHLLTELEHLADHLLVLHEGQVRFSGTPQDMLARHKRLVIGVDGNVRQALQVLTQAGQQGKIESDNTLSLVFNHLTLEKAQSLLHNKGIRLTAFHQLQPTLEAAMLQRLRTDQAKQSVGE